MTTFINDTLEYIINAGFVIKIESGYDKGSLTVSLSRSAEHDPFFTLSGYGLESLLDVAQKACAVQVQAKSIEIGKVY
jgi:hypothetical protein